MIKKNTQISIITLLLTNIFSILIVKNVMSHKFTITINVMLHIFWKLINNYYFFKLALYIFYYYGTILAEFTSLFTFVHPTDTNI